MLITLAVWSGQAQAIGLGAIALQSGLSRPLQASIPVHGMAADEAGAACLKSRVLALDGSLLARAVAELAGSGASAAVNIRTVENINEPAVTVTVEIGCASAIRREYQLLLDPLPATLPAAISAPTERAAAAENKAASRPGVRPASTPPAAAANAPVPAASVARRAPAPAKARPVAETRSVLTLTGGDAEIEQVRAGVALRSATVLSEPRVETDPARLAALRADQARVAALLRGENPAAGAQAQLRAAEEKLLAAQKSAASAAQQHQQEKAALTAAQEDMVAGKLAALLGALLFASIAIIGWLLWRRADERRRQEQAFFAMAEQQDALPVEALHQPRAAQHIPDTASTAFAPPAAPPADARLEPQPMDFSLPAEDFAPAPAHPAAQPSHEWSAEAVTPTAALDPPETLQLPESWLALENPGGETGAQAPGAEDRPLALPATQGEKQAHAAEVAGMLLAAENWMAEHNPLRAAEVLRPYLDRFDMQSPAPGLYLLSLYRTMDDREQSAAVLAQLQQHFPTEAAAWTSLGQERRSMADFPAVHAVVDSLSDSDQLLPYLNSLLLAPEAFDFSTYRDIVRAIGLATEMKQQSDMQSMSLDFH